MPKTIHFLFVLLFTTSGAFSQDRFDQWDRDGDGKLAKEELPEPIRINFDRVDTDGNGFISKQEHLAVRKPGTRTPRKEEGLGEKVADIDYSGDENPRQMLDLYLPEGYRDSEKPLPLVCWIHGGGWKNGNKSNIGLVRKVMATGDYAGASIGYRLSDEAQWPSQIHDCKAAIRWLKANAEKYNLDPNRIAVAGSSAGGHLVAMLGVSHGVEHLEGDIGPHGDLNSEVACVVDLYGPTELLTMSDFGGAMDHNSPNSPESSLIGGPILENKDKANDASPIKHVSEDDEPFLIIHGSEDPVVVYQQSTAFEKALEAAGVPAILVTVEGGGHGKGFGPETNEIAIEFLNKLLLNKGDLPVDQTIEATGRTP